MRGFLDTLSPLDYNFPRLVIGPVAQLGARFNRTEEVAGSNPARSTFLARFVLKVDEISLCGKISFAS